MSKNQQEALFAALSQLLEPLVRVLLRNGVPYGAFAEIARKIYVNVADQYFGVPGRKQTNSRISTITGLSRKEVQRLKALQDQPSSDNLQRYNRAARVVTGWVRDPRYHDEQGQPADLPFDADDKTPSFSNLVRSFSGDVPPRAILDELQRTGVVDSTSGNIRLLARAYIPKTGEVEKLTILGTSVAGLISTIDHNIVTGGKDPYFQRQVIYDNLPEEAIVELRKLIDEQAQQLLEQMDHWMAAHDRDINPDVKGSGRKAAGIGAYFFLNDVEGEE